MFRIPSASKLAPINLGRVPNHRQQNRFATTGSDLTETSWLATLGGRASVSGITAVVFGATGFLGRYIINKLGRSGSRVVIPYRSDRSYDHLKVMGDLGQIVPVAWDSRHKESILRAMSRCNVVINLVNRDWETRNFSYEDVNVKAPKLIAQCAKESGIERLIHLSPAGTTNYSRSRWSRSKYLGEQTVKEEFPEVTVIKPCPLFGYEDRFLNRVGTMISQWPFFPLVNPYVRIQPTYVDDVASAVVSCLKLPHTAGKTYYLGGDKIYTNMEIAKYVQKETRYAEKKIVILPDDYLWFLHVWGKYWKNRRIEP
eukprot:TRINITY_DN4497_c0_g1_i1.p1 TRINITY_DN4497_c0_g1~~TRINITY_DN4497_c0_g1_i1.p1  ORF type:complete len:313 (-),score=27.68 TRINITY_DN4497_c0_g1_i1:289-1227(-)